MKKIALILSLLSLSACGFHPVYGTHGADEGSPVALDMNNVTIDNIADRDGQMLRNDLIDRMYAKNRPSHPQYELKIKIHSTEQNLGILENASATRALIDMTGDYTLTDTQGRELVRGTAHSVASFDLLDEIYGSVAARESAHEHSLHEISEQIVSRLSLYFSDRQ